MFSIPGMTVPNSTALCFPCQKSQRPPSRPLWNGLSTKVVKQIHKFNSNFSGNPHPIVERDPNTGEKKWSEFNEFQEEFFKVNQIVFDLQSIKFTEVGH